MFLEYVQVTLLGILGSASLIVGAFFGYYFNIPKKIIAITIAFTVGVLTSSVCFELLFEAYHYGGSIPTVIGFFIGLITFTLSNIILNHLNIKKNVILKDFQNENDNKNTNLNNVDTQFYRANGFLSFKNLKNTLFNINKGNGCFNKYQIESYITIISALLDGIPEALAIGLMLVVGGPISISILISIFIANLFEGVSSSRNMKLGGWKVKSIFKVWFFVLILAAFATLFSYSIFSNTDQHILSGALGVSAGALVAIISDILLPDAYSETQEFIGVFVGLGLLFSFLLSHMS
jgi:ZIP family zinc transporter